MKLESGVHSIKELASVKTVAKAYCSGWICVEKRGVGMTFSGSSGKASE
ncbi:hypothetical protein A2U01_0046736 [Trifolium medium]|uniref:Uncharacterized protein n=1 Tax=Trifolium medium TaxID=97028 RepID=A0A392QQI4_9FABA|nr:hypothetical protein [Trifolium medium]